MKLGSIVDSGFQSSLTKLIACDLPVRTAFKLKGIATTIATEHEKYNKLRMELITRFAETEENGELKKQENGDAVFTESEYEKFLGEFRELQSIDVEIPTIALSELETLKGFKADDFLRLGDLIEAD